MRERLAPMIDGAIWGIFSTMLILKSAGLADIPWFVVVTPLGVVVGVWAYVACYLTPKLLRETKKLTDQLERKATP